MDHDNEKDFKPLNSKEKPSRPTAVALRDNSVEGQAAEIIASGRGKIAEQILAIAFENGIHVREDSALAEMLATIDIDSPIPQEAFAAVAEILSYVYKANGQENPFDHLKDDGKEDSDVE